MKRSCNVEFYACGAMSLSMLFFRLRRLTGRTCILDIHCRVTGSLGSMYITELSNTLFVGVRAVPLTAISEVGLAL
jgi:hypothetical protein